MEKDKIDDIIVDIMVNDGPDGHCDGHEIITEFIISLLENKEEEWIKEYYHG